MISRDLALLALAALLSGCGGGTEAAPGFGTRGFSAVNTSGELVDLVATRPMEFPNGSEMTLAPDGTLSGEAGGQPLAGDWRFANGQLCRTMVVGGLPTPEVCNALEVSEESVRFLDANGALVVEAALGAG